MALVRDIEPWDALLETGRTDERLVMQESQNARPPRTVPIPEELHPDVVAALRAQGIERLWSHQAEALHATWAGPTIVTTGTASGKSLCFNLPTLDVLSRDARARALYLYPAKALAQDQSRALHALGVRNARPAIYDGDTPREQRLQVRRRSNLVLTNPDMLHLGILPNHGAWGDFLANLAVVVVDEAHVYRGVFGSHVANVLRRLRRVARAYGTEPRFLLASATIANPGELAERLTGLEPFTVIDRDGSPGHRRTIAMWNPPIVDEALATRRSSLGAAVCVTFPGTVASLRQMWGRAGRRGRGLAVYVAGEDALDQFFCRHPDEFLDRPVEVAILDHENEQIHAGHILCAAHEGPLDAADDATLGPGWRATAERLLTTGDLRRRPNGTFVPRATDGFPAAEVSLRSASRDNVAIVDTGSGELLGTVEMARAHTTTHEGAIYLHGGRSYEVAALDLENRRALVHPFSGDWYTQPKRETDTYIERLLDRRG